MSLAPEAEEQIKVLTEALQKLKKERAQQHELVRQIIDAAPAIMWIEDSHGKIQFLSPLGKLEEESHFPAAVIRENGWLQAIRSNLFADVAPGVTASGLPSNQVDYRLQWQRNIQSQQAFEIDLPLTGAWRERSGIGSRPDRLLNRSSPCLVGSAPVVVLMTRKD